MRDITISVTEDGKLPDVNYSEREIIKKQVVVGEKDAYEVRYRKCFFNEKSVND